MTCDGACLQLPMNTWRVDSWAAIGPSIENMGGDYFLKDQ